MQRTGPALRRPVPAPGRAAPFARANARQRAELSLPARADLRGAARRSRRGDRGLHRDGFSSSRGWDAAAPAAPDLRGAPAAGRRAPARRAGGHARRRRPRSARRAYVVMADVWQRHPRRYRAAEAAVRGARAARAGPNPGGAAARDAQPVAAPGARTAPAPAPIAAAHRRAVRRRRVPVLSRPRGDLEDDRSRPTRARARARRRASAHDARLRRSGRTVREEQRSRACSVLERKLASARARRRARRRGRHLRLRIAELRVGGSADSSGDRGARARAREPARAARGGADARGSRAARPQRSR